MAKSGKSISFILASHTTTVHAKVVDISTCYQMLVQNRGTRNYIITDRQTPIKVVERVKKLSETVEE